MRKLRLWFKLLTRRFIQYMGFCKECGVSVRDFHAPDDVWDRVRPLIKHGDVLCYQCFCDKCEQAGLFPVWKLEYLDDSEIYGEEDACYLCGNEDHLCSCHEIEEISDGDTCKTCGFVFKNLSCGCCEGCWEVECICVLDEHGAPIF